MDSKKVKKFLKLFSMGIFTFLFAFGIRMLEWSSWQNPEYKFGNEMLLATHDAYHWVAGAVGFGRAVDHPMAMLLRLIHEVTGIMPANAAFWLPAVMASFVAVILFAWCMFQGAPLCGVACGVMVSIAPGFLGRTLLGYYDTDLVTLLFPLCMALIPALWIKFFIFGDYSLIKFLRSRPIVNEEAAFSSYWIILLALAGLFSWYASQWHSVFPYLIRCNIIISGLMAFFAANRKKAFFMVSAYAISGIFGGIGFIIILVFYIWPFGNPIKKLLQRPWILVILWVFIGISLLSGGILDLAWTQINAYLKVSGDVHNAAGIPLVFPSVAQSIIEVQNLDFAVLFSYFHPWFEGAVLGIAGFFLATFARPLFVFLLPLAILAFSSAKLGGRMVMFGAPIVAIGLTFITYGIVKWSLQKTVARKISSCVAFIILIGVFVIPYLNVIPALSQGPVLNRRHAAALAQAGKISDPEDILWVWWDWGYAAQYFARRNTICDGAQHGGPSLYLPAAVFATDNPRFARQIIRRTSTLDNEPGNFFKGMDAAQAQQLVNTLRSRHTPLVKGENRQYVITSFELLKLGFWVSNFGSWNFISATGEGGALSIIPQALSYNLALGEVRLDDSGRLIFPASINVFEETGVIKRDYLQEWLDKNPHASKLQQQIWLAGRRNINFLFNRVTNEKLAMDERMYNSLMTQLLICEPGDQRFSPYFKLVFDNVFVRIYQVLPVHEEKS